MSRTGSNSDCCNQSSTTTTNTVSTLFGTAAAPAFTFQDAPTTGMFYDSVVPAGIAFATNGVKRFKITDTALSVTAGESMLISLINMNDIGTVGAPAISISNLLTGIYSTGPGNFSVASNGTQFMSLGSGNASIIANNVASFGINGGPQIVMLATGTMSTTAPFSNALQLNQGWQNIYSARIKSVVTQTVGANSTTQLVNMTTIVYDTSPSVNMTGTANEIIFQLSGRYLITVSGLLNTAATGDIAVIVLKNGLATPANDLHRYDTNGTAASGNGGHFTLTFTESFVATDFIALGVSNFQAANNLLVGGPALADNLYMSAEFLSHV